MELPAEKATNAAGSWRARTMRSWSRIPSRGHTRIRARLCMRTLARPLACVRARAHARTHDGEVVAYPVERSLQVRCMLHFAMHVAGMSSGSTETYSQDYNVLVVAAGLKLKAYEGG